MIECLPVFKKNYKKQMWIPLLFLLLMAQIIRAEDNRVEVKADIEKSPVLVINVVVDGLTKEQKANAMIYLKIEKNKKNPDLNERWLKRLHSRAVENIKQSLHPFGYYQAEVKSKLKQNDSGDWLAHYQVTPGERVRINSIDLQINGSGAKAVDIIALKAKYAIKKNDYLDHELYESAKTDLMSSIGILGYNDVKIEKKQLLIDPKKNIADIILHINTGEQFFLGELRIHQDILRPDFVSKFITDVKPGDPYSQERLLNIQQLLVKSGYFSIVDIKPAFEEVEQHKVPIDINLSPAKRHKLSFGVGYDTQIDLNASFGWQNRLLNSYGHHSDLLLKLSDVKSLLRATYWIPVGEPGEEKIGVTSSIEKETLDDVEWTAFNLEAAYYFNWYDFKTNIFTEYKNESASSDHSSTETTQLLSFGIRMEGAFFEEGIYPRRGWSGFAGLRGSPAVALTDTAYMRLHLKSRIFFPLFDSGRLLLRGELGLAEVDTFEKYPASLRFFAGGDQSIRGYDWKSIGPLNADGDVVGGRNIITTSIEYNHKISQTWIAATFLDAGNAYNNDLNKLYYGAGVGARWISPIGLVKFDLGWPINAADRVVDSSSPVLYFGFEVNL